MYNPYEDQNNQNPQNPQEPTPSPQQWQQNPTETQTPIQQTSEIPSWHIPTNHANVTSEPPDSNHTNEQQFYDSGFNPPSPQTETPAKKKNNGLKFTALFLACALISTACGIGGTMIVQNMNGGRSTKTPVLTQSLVNTATTSAKGESSVASVANAVAESVVEITTESVTTNQMLQQYISEGAGSGVVITEDGYIVTNNHVIEGANKIRVRLKNGESYDAKLIGADAETDIAVIKIEENGLKSAVFGDSDTLTVGEQAIAIGNPLGSLGGTVTEGIISALDREINIQGNTMHLLQTTAAINPGNSGGGLFNANGELVGVVNAKTSASGIEGLGFAIPSNTAKKITEDLISNGYVTGKVRLGVSMIEIADEQQAMQYRVSETGIYISKVDANSDAYYGGLKAGDRVVAINGEEITSTSQMQEIVQGSEVGNTLEIQISRNGQKETVSVTLTEYNSNLSAFGE